MLSPIEDKRRPGFSQATKVDKEPQIAHRKHTFSFGMRDDVLQLAHAN